MTNGVSIPHITMNRLIMWSQACFLAKRVKQYPNLPATSLVTDDVERVKKFYKGNEVFDKIIASEIKRKNRKTYNDGTLPKKVLEFKNYNLVMLMIYPR